MSRILWPLCVGVLSWLGPFANGASAENLTPTLLRQICDARNIRGNECSNAKNYPQRKRCNVKLSDDRHEGRFVPSQAILIVNYESDCEPHATNFGGSVVFERSGQGYAFNSYHPGLLLSDCASLPKDARQDRLVCLTGHMGQGFLESTISEIGFTRSTSKPIKTSLNVLVRATDSAGAYGANKVECKEPRVLFGFSDIEGGAQPDTLLVTVQYADREVIAQACRPGAPVPEDVVTSAEPGAAFIDPKAIKKRQFSLDLKTRRLQPR